MLLNLMAALSLASAGAVAGIVSKPQSVDGVQLNKSSLIERKNAVAYDSPMDFPSYWNLHSSLTSDVLFDGDLFFYGAAPVSIPDIYDPVFCPSGACVRVIGDTIINIKVSFDSSGFSDSEYLSSFVYYLDSNLIGYSSGSSTFKYQGDSECVLLSLYSPDDDSNYIGPVASLAYHRLTILKSTYSYDDYMADHSIVGGIASGLTSVQHYATSLVSGFDALALDNGALTNSMAFAFTLLGIGTAVGICKLTFNWITGRHGM